MKANTTLDEVLSPSLPVLIKLLSSDDSNFVSLAGLAHANRRTDFRHSDLACVDFSNCDLRDFDFTGSDLRGATGVNVTWDQTTILKDAEVGSSLFAHRLAKERFFQENPHLAEQVARLNKNHWTGTINGAADMLMSDQQPKGHSVWVAKALFDETKMTAVKSNILYFMKPALENPDEHKGFIYNIFAEHSTETNIVKSAIRTLNELYASDIGAVNVLAKFLDHPDIAIRKEALKGILRSPYFMSARDKLLAYVMASGDSTLRRQFLGRVVQNLGPEYVNAVAEPNGKQLLDFAERLPTRKILTIAERALLRERLARQVSGDLRSGQVPSFKVKESQITERAQRYRELLETLKINHKIPFVFVDE